VGDVCTVEHIYESPMKDTRLGVKKQDGRIGFCSPDNVVKLNGKIEVGDTVELLSTDEPTLQGFNAGDVCTVTGVYESIIMRGTRLEIYNADNRLGYCSPEKVVKFNGKIEVGDEVILDAGDDEDSYPLNGF